MTDTAIDTDTDIHVDFEIDLSQLTAAQLRPCLQQVFRLNVMAQIPGQAAQLQTIPLELVEVEDLPKHTESPRTGFALRFLGPPSRHHLPQRIYTLRHEAFGRMSIFLTPIGPIAGSHPPRMRYEAVFN